MNRSTESRLKALRRAGQSVWLDFITRDLLASGELARLIESDGVCGVTSNPSIFQKSISQMATYATLIDEYSRRGMEPEQVYESLALADIRAACDVLAPVYERTKARDGYVSLEVNPHVAYDADATLMEVQRLFSAVARPNVMIKIPATLRCLPAITRAISEGININVTLIFSVERYEHVFEAWLCGLEAAAENRSLKLANIACVASFFVSRVDSAVDPILEAQGPEHAALRGLAAIANAAAAYGRFLEMRSGPRFAALAARGAQVQRPLWASTTPKNSSYRDVAYVEGLVASDTVTTLPPQTLEAFRAHGDVRSDLASTAAQTDAARVLRALSVAEVDLRAIAKQLEHDGLKLFADAFDSLLKTIGSRSTAA